MRRVLAGVALAVVAAGCSSSGSSSRHPAAAPNPPAPSTAPAPSASSNPPAPTNTVWLCRPDRRPDPCVTDLTTTVVSVSGARHTEAAPAPAATGLDCFYVYPTVSPQTTANADLRIQPAQRRVARAQAAPFSDVCRVWAPVYRQRTSNDLFNLGDGAPQSGPNLVAFASVESAWRDYLAHHNDGRPVVFIGHSQGASMLIRLLRADIDPDPALRAKTALAILLGGNVTVAPGRLTGGSFQHLALCTHPAQRGCVIAYSSFPAEPPAYAFFGRAGSGVSMLSGETATDRDVACVNPVRIGGGAAPLHSAFPTGSVPGVSASTPWVSASGRYVARCRHAGRTTWLQVTPAPGLHETTPALTESLGPAWGYHVADVNLALDDLVADVRAVGRH